MSEQSHKIFSEGKQKIPLWVARESHIFKKAFHTWNYRVFRVLYSGDTSSRSFLELAYLLVLPYFIMTFLAITFPYAMIAFFITAILMMQVSNYFKRHGRLHEADSFVTVMLIPFGALVFFSFAPEWTVIFIFPFVAILVQRHP